MRQNTPRPRLEIVEIDSSDHEPGNLGEGDGHHVDDGDDDGLGNLHGPEHIGPSKHMFVILINIF